MSTVDRGKLLPFLYASVFLVSMAIGTAMTLVSVQAEHMGASLLDIGLMGTGAAAAYTVMTLIAGTLLDRFEKLRLYLVFNILSTGSLILLALAQDLNMIFVARILMGVVGGTFWTSAGALTADLAPTNLLTHAIGRYNLSWILGFVFGPLFGGMIADMFGYSTLWAILAGVMVLGIGFNFILISKIRLDSVAKLIKFDFKAVYGLRWAYLTMIPYAMGLGIYFYILPGYMASFGISSTAIGILLAASNIVKGAGFYLSEKVVASGIRKGMLVGAFMMAISLFVVGYANTDLGFLTPLLLFGAANGIIEPLLMDFIAHGSPKASLGTTMGVYEGMYGAFTCVSPMAAGIVSEAYSTSVVYVALAAISLFIIPTASKMGKKKSINSDTP